VDRRSYGTDRWKILYGSLDGAEGRAVELLYGGVSQEVPYVLCCERAEGHGDLTGISLLVIGTRESNPVLASLPQASDIPAEGYTVQVLESPFDPARQLAVIAGSSPAEAIYAAAHFLEYYLPLARQNQEHHPYFLPLFSRPMPPYRAVEEPAFSERGLWTWGHCIYDYRVFARNMALLGLNAITIWNDFAPVNLPQVVEHFHSYGIKVYAGYSWGWEEPVDVNSQADLERWKERTVSNYQENYAGSGVDGVYFQSFTETSEDTIAGVPISQAVTR
jgi:hypothetical protein